MKTTMNKVAALGLVLASVVALAAPAQAEVKLPNGLSFGTTIFADYINASDNVNTNYAATNGFHINRAYFYMKSKINDNMSAKVTLDASNNTASPNVWVKNAYLDYGVNDMVSVQAGLNNTPWVDYEQKLWGYRNLGATNNIAGKVFTDKNGLLSSADNGVSIYGGSKPKAAGFSYHVGFYNGEGYNKVPDASGSLIAGKVSYQMDNGLGVAAYYGTESVKNGTANYDPTRLLGMIYYTQPTYTVAAEYISASDFTSAAAPATNLWADGNGFSVFGHVLVADNIRLLTRYDSATPNTRATYTTGAGASTLNRTNTVLTVGATYIMDKDQEVTLAYSTASNGAPAATTVNTISVDLMTGF